MISDLIVRKNLWKGRVTVINCRSVSSPPPGNVIKVKNLIETQCFGTIFVLYGSGSCLKYEYGFGSGSESSLVLNSV